MRNVSRSSLREQMPTCTDACEWRQLQVCDQEYEAGAVVLAQAAPHLDNKNELSARAAEVALRYLCIFGRNAGWLRRTQLAACI